MQATKRAMGESLKRLLQEKPLSKVTIADIAEDCGISRMTFYYHFQDIYDLIDWICQDEGRRAVAGRSSSDTWQSGFLALCSSVLENRAFVENVYRSVQREKIENYMYQVVYDLLLDAIREQAKGRPVTEENLHLIADFFKYAFVGEALSWVDRGMKETPQELTDTISTLINGQISQAIENFCPANQQKSGGIAP